MTTKVSVLNHGPNPVQVKVMNRYPAVNTREVRIPDNRPRVVTLESKYRGPPLLVGETQEHYVHGGQELHVVELLHQAGRPYNPVEETPA